MFLIGAFVFLVAELAAFVAVGEQIGFGWAVLLVIGLSALGPFIIRRVGLGVLARARARLDRGDVPTREVLDGVVVLGGGILMCLPGFVSGALGLLLMIRPVRGLTILAGGRWLARRVKTAHITRWRPIDARSRSTSLSRLSR
ncbi:MAG: FxsA family protein [Acidimicrobiaceae bacterium]|nr:FxsA family protein [Acidimicrobiaceae bacterium]